jgi:hypothetical protein
MRAPFDVSILDTDFTDFLSLKKAGTSFGVEFESERVTISAYIWNGKELSMVSPELQ